MSTTPQDFAWLPPDRPDHPEYKKLLAFIDELKRRDPKKGMAWFAAACERDFWLWQWKVMSLGNLEIRDPGHRHSGKLWVMEGWFFDRMREVQDDFDRGRTDVYYQFGRFMFKTSAIQKGGSLWFAAKDRTETVGIFTHKLDQVGEGMGKDILNEIKGNVVLRAHWPQFRALSEASSTRITVDRPPGIREPTISLHGILGSAASGHFRKIFVDDAVTEKSNSPAICAEVDQQISLMTPLQSDDSQRFWIGTPWNESDPLETRRKKGGFFTLIRSHPGILPGDKPQLRSMSFYNNWRRTMLEHHFAAQILLKLIPPGNRYFREEWLRRYCGTPEQVAWGSRIHIIIDPAEGAKEGKTKASDYLIIRVYAFSFDKKRRALDLVREKIGIADALDILFGVLPDNPEEEDMYWKKEFGPKGMVGKWARYDPDITAWVENVGASSFDQTIRREMMHRKSAQPGFVSCQVRELRSNLKKENRIATLQPQYRNGVFEYPLRFGHGSYTTGDSRDTLEQFIQDEYKQWTLAGEIQNDDMLDDEAWTALPNAQFGYPEAPPEALLYGRGFLSSESALASGGGWGADAWSEASWRVS